MARWVVTIIRAAVWLLFAVMVVIIVVIGFGALGFFKTGY